MNSETRKALISLRKMAKLEARIENLQAQRDALAGDQFCFDEARFNEALAIYQAEVRRAGPGSALLD